MSTETNTLAPCPFCGSTKLEVWKNPHAFVRCIECVADGPEIPSRNAAIAAWNRRPPSPASPVREALEKLVAIVREVREEQVSDEIFGGGGSAIRRAASAVYAHRIAAAAEQIGEVLAEADAALSLPAAAPQPCQTIAGAEAAAKGGRDALAAWWNAATKEQRLRVIDGARHLLSLISAPQPCQDVTETAKRIAWAAHTALLPDNYDDADDLWTAMSVEKKGEWLSAARSVTPAAQPVSALSAAMHPIIREMVEVATGEDADPDWMADQRAQVDDWQSRIRDACAPHDPYDQTAPQPQPQADVSALVEALKRIATGETTTHDDDLGHDVIVSMDADEMQEVARAALRTAQAKGE